MKRIHGLEIAYSHAPNTKREESHSLRRVWYRASREPNDTRLESQLPRTCIQRHDTYNTALSGFSVFMLAEPRPLREFWFGPINAALKRLKLPTVTPGAASALSSSSVSLFVCRLSDAFSSFLAHAAINLEPPLHTGLYLYQALGSSAVVLQSPVMPNNRRYSATLSIHS